MENVIAINKESRIVNSLEFMNEFGAVFTDGVLIHQYSKTIPIRYDFLKKIQMHKRRKFHWNLICFLIASLLISAPFLYSLPMMAKLSFGTGAVLAVALGIFIKKYDYRILIHKENDFVALEVKHKSKDDAKKIALKVNKKLKTLRESA